MQKASFASVWVQKDFYKKLYILDENNEYYYQEASSFLVHPKKENDKGKILLQNLCAGKYQLKEAS